MSTIKVFVPGKGEVKLTPTDHLASGGEGAVYLKNGTAFKLFLEPAKARANGMANKIDLLSRIKHPYIIAPQSPLLDATHQLIGYTMPEAKGLPLVKTFTNAWREQAGFADKQAAELVNNMRTAVQAAHALQAIIVDGNEMNYLANGVEPRLIDVDSWQVGPHAATALMPSIRDFHRQGFDEMSDWFSWGIVSFQVLTGIHPYKGTHPDFRKGDLEARMRANASVFDKRVKMSPAVRDFSCIPPALAAWYEGVFQQGSRSAPPDFLRTGAPTALTKKVRVRQTNSGVVKHERVLGLSGKIRHVSGNGIAFYEDQGQLQAYDLYRKQKVRGLSANDIDALFENQAGLIRFGNGFVYLVVGNNQLSGRIVTGERDPIPQQTDVNILTLMCEKLVVVGNQAYALNPQSTNGLVELDITEMGNRTVLSVKASWPVNTRSTRFFDGFGVMDCIGVPFIVMPDQSRLIIARAPSLIGYRIINGFGRSPHRLWVNAVKREDGQTYRLELQMGAKEFGLLSETLVDLPELNMAISPKGISVGFHEDGIVSVRNTLGTGAQEIKDSSVGQEMQLFSLPDGIFYHVGSDVFRLSLG